MSAPPADALTGQKSLEMVRHHPADDQRLCSIQHRHRHPPDGGQARLGPCLEAPSVPNDLGVAQLARTHGSIHRQPAFRVAAVKNHRFVQVGSCCPQHLGKALGIGLLQLVVFESQPAVDEALKGKTNVERVLVVKRTGQETAWNNATDIWWHEIVNRQSAEHVAESFDAEHPLFILYTSGTTA